MGVGGGMVDLDSLGLRSGEAVRLEPEVELSQFSLSGEQYLPQSTVPVSLDISRTRSGWSFHLKFNAELSADCVRCLKPSQVAVVVDHFEIDQGNDDELASSYVSDELLDLGRLCQDCVILESPHQILCEEECLGLCPQCGADLNAVEPGSHQHEKPTDPRWSKLKELKL